MPTFNNYNRKFFRKNILNHTRPSEIIILFSYIYTYLIIKLHLENVNIFQNTGAVHRYLYSPTVSYEWFRHSGWLATQSEINCFTFNFKLKTGGTACVT